MRCRVGLALGAIFFSFVYCSEATNFLLNVSGKKPISRSADRFLSITIDPIKLLNANQQPGKVHRSIILARALSPAYVRFECPSCDSSKQNHEPHQQDRSSARNFTFSETQWSNLHEWSKTAGLDAVTCIQPEMINDGKQPAVDLISFSDRMGYNSGWQLGYECQSRCEVTGSALAKKVSRLRDALNGFPRYSDSIIIGPDVVEWWKEGQRGFLEDYFAKAGHALTAITWHPSLQRWNLKENETLPRDDLADQKVELDKILPESAQRLPVWLAESEPEARKKGEAEVEVGGRGQYLGALFWARRLGSAAKLDIQVLMRQPADLFEPTPEYWVSLLHKMFVGPEVVGTRIQIKNDSDVFFYTQCTRSSEKYRRGAVTIFGVNLTPQKAIGKLKGIAGTTVHKYILTPGTDKTNILSATSVKLNRVPLKLTYDEKIPAINPVTMTKDKGFSIRLPPYSIGFWVVPDANMKACMRNEKEEFNKSFQTHQVSANLNEIKENEHIFHSLDSSQNGVGDVRTISRKQRDLSGIESDRSRKSGRKGAEREIRKLENYLKRRYTNQRRPDKSPRRGPITSFDHFKQIIESRQNKRPRRSPIKPIVPEHFNARRDVALKSRARLEEERERRLERRNKEKQREYMPAYLEKNDKDDDFYGFFKQEPVDTFPKNDVYLMTGDSTEDNDYEYVKDEDDPKDEKKKPNAGHATEQDDTWVEDGNDFRGYVPNEFFENSKIHNVRVQNVKDFSELWEADCDCQNANQDNSEDDSKTMEVIKVHPDEIQQNSANLNNDWVIQKTDHVGNSNNQFGVQNLQNGGFSQPTHNKKPQRFSDGVDQVTPGRINSFSNERDAWRNGRDDGNFRRLKREAEKIRDVNDALYKEMINEDAKNFENCDCNQRVIRDGGNFQKHCDCATKQKRHAGQEYYEKFDYDTKAYEAENMEEGTDRNYQNKANYFYDETYSQPNPSLNNQKRSAVPDHTPEVHNSSLSAEGKEVKNVESTTTNLNIQKKEDKKQHTENPPLMTVNDSATSKSTLTTAKKQEKSVELTTVANLDAEKIEDQYQHDVSRPLEMANNPIIDEIPQIIIYAETKNEPISDKLNATEQKVYETSTPSTEKTETSIATQRKSVGKVSTELDKHSTTPTYPKEETDKVSEFTTAKIEHTTSSVNASNEAVTTEKPQVKENEEERKEPTPTVYSKESEYEHETSKPVKKDTIYATAIPSLIHEDVVTEDTPNLKMKSQFISHSQDSLKYSELEDEPEESFTEKTDHKVSPSPNSEVEDMVKSTDPPKEPISHIMRHFSRPSGETLEAQKKPSAKIKRQSKKESTELFRNSESRTEEMASDLQRSTTVPEGPTSVPLEKMQEVHLSQYVPVYQTSQESQKATPMEGSNKDHEHLNLEIPNAEHTQLQKTELPDESTTIHEHIDDLNTHSQNVQNPQNSKTSEIIPEAHSNPQVPPSQDLNSTEMPKNTNSAPTQSSVLQTLSNPPATSSPSVDRTSSIKTIENGTKFTGHLSECETKSCTKDEETKSYASTTFPATESGILRDEVLKSKDIERVSTEMARDESENSVGTSTGNMPARNLTMEKSNGGKEIPAEKSGRENGTLAENSDGEKGVTEEKPKMDEEVSTGKSMGEGELTKSSPDDYIVGATLSQIKALTSTSEKSITTETPNIKNTTKAKLTLAKDETKDNITSTKNSSTTNVQSPKDMNEHNLKPTRQSNDTNSPATESSLKDSIPSKNSTKAKSEKQSSNPELVKARRSATRSEALLALKRENDARRARRLAEYIKQQEYQRKRAEQLDELRQRLRQKREKMLEKYRIDLLALEKSFGDAGKTLKRRDALQDIVEDDLTDLVDPGKPMYVRAYDPIDHEPEEDELYQRREMGRRILLPVVERPLRAMRERILLPNDYSRGYRDLHLVKCASCSIPRTVADSVRYIDDDEDARRMYRYMDIDEPWMIEYEQRPRTNIYDQSEESIDQYSAPKKSTKIREIPMNEQSSKSRLANSLGAEYLREVHPGIPESSSDEEAASAEYEDEKMHDDEVSGSVSDGKGAENRPIVYLFDSKQPQSIPSDVYEQSVRALLNILAQRGIDRDIVQSAEARGSSKNKRSPRNDSVGDYAANLSNEVKEDSVKTEIDAPSEETNRRKRAINNWMLIDPDNVETSNELHSTQNAKNRMRLDDNSLNLGKNIDSLPYVHQRTRNDLDSIEISNKFNSLFNTDNRVGTDDVADPFRSNKGSLPKMSIKDSWEINGGFERYGQQDPEDNKQDGMNEIDPVEDQLFREHFQRKDELLKEVREPKNVLIKRLKDGAEKQEGKARPMSAIEKSLPTREGIAGEFEKAQNLTGSLDEFVENFRGNGNGTLTDDERKRVDGNGSSSVHRAFDSMVMNISRLFSFLCHIVRVFQG